MGLTAKRIARLHKPGRYGDEAPNLYLQVTRRGVKSWIFRYEINGRERWLGLGPLHTVSLKAARERARNARLQLLDGIDPLEAKVARRAAAALEAAKALTFEEAVRQYFDGHERKWGNAKHRHQFMASMKAYAFPKIGNLPVAAIDTGLVLKVIEPIWATKTETANRVRRRIEHVLDWATVRGYRAGDNPARWRGYLSQALPARQKLQKTAHHAALPYADTPAFMAKLAAHEGVATRALEFAILTAARTSEVLGATWDEIDFKAKTWTIPAKRMKGNREHRVPLSPRALELLHALPRIEGNPHLFVGQAQAALPHTAMGRQLRRLGRSDVTVHGFRSTFMDWAHERTAFPKVVIDMALAHTVGNKVEAAYRRGDLFDKRRKLMDAWAQFCAKPAVAGEVVSLRSAS
jgi:integrase